MAEQHPDELGLLAYVEDELDADERRDVAEHLVACRSCAQHVRLLEAGREALRGAPQLEPPPELLRGAIASLPERREPWRPLAPLRRALLVAAPVAGAAALVAVLVVGGSQLGGGGDDEGAGDAAGDRGAQMEAQEPAAEGDGADAGAGEEALLGTLVRSVSGPPRDVVELLRREGIEAEVVGTAVSAEATAADVRAALARRPDGPVEVYVR